MTQAAARDDEYIEPMPKELLKEPLDWLFAEHFRHRQWCRLIETLAKSGIFDEEALSAAVAFLREDLPLHILDEEEDLFPLLRRRAVPEDDLERILGILSADHRIDQERVTHLLVGLNAALVAKKAPGLDADLRALMLDFVTKERRHVALENAIVIPLARLRLSAIDLKSLSARLGARRGIPLQDPTNA